MLGTASAGATNRVNPFRPFAPGNVFEEDVTAMEAAADQTPAKKLANQLSYNRTDYTHWYGYTGPGYVSGGLNPAHIQVGTYTATLWVVPPGQPTTKLTYVNNSGKPQAPGAATNLQSHFEAVPMPTLAKIPSGDLICPVGTDGWFWLWQPSTDQLWECWVFNQELLTFKYGGYISEVSKWNGIFPNAWGARATGLSLIGGTIVQQDLVEVMRASALGKTPVINHALAVDIPVTKAAGPVQPATRHDEGENSLAKYPGEAANPAFGAVDGVAESSWFRFPTASTPAEYGITRPIEVAIFEAIRRYGLFVADSSGNSPCSLYMDFPAAAGSPYAWQSVNPLAGAPGEWSGAYGWMPAGMTDSTLPKITENPAGAASCLTKQPFQILEQVKPRAS